MMKIIKSALTRDKSHELRIVSTDDHRGAAVWPPAAVYHVELIESGGDIVGRTAKLDSYFAALDVFYAMKKSAEKYNTMQF